MFFSTRADHFHLNGDTPAALVRVIKQSADLHRERLLVESRNPRVEAGAKHFRRFACLDTPLFDSGFWEGRFTGISESPFSMAAYYSFRPSSRTFILRRGGCHELRQRLTVIPWHPIRRMRGELRDMPLQLREVVEGIDSVQLTGMDQTHE